MIQTKKLTFTYREFSKGAFEPQTWKILPHEHTWVHGPHGSGKSTLLKVIINSAVPLLSGSQSGDLISDLKDEDVFYEHGHQPGIFHFESLHDEWMFCQQTWGGQPLNRFSNADDAFKAFHIDHLASKKTSELSRGEQHLLKLVIPLSLRWYPWMILDEPFVFIDLPKQDMIFSHIKYHVEQGSTLIVADHAKKSWHQHIDFFNSIALTPQFEYQPWLDIALLKTKNTDPKKITALHDIKKTMKFIESVALKPKTWLLLEGPNGIGKTQFCMALLSNLCKNKQSPVQVRMLMDQTRLMYFSQTLGQEWEGHSTISHPYAQRPSNALSEGECKIEMLQRVLADQPDLLLVDDLFEGLNTLYRTYACQWLKAYKNAGGIIVHTTSSPLSDKERRHIDNTFHLGGM